MRIATHGWAITRGLAPPVAVPGGWRIEVGAADQVRRWMFSDALPELAEAAAQISEPFVLLKATAEPDQVARLLPSHLRAEQTGYVMGIDRLPDGDAEPSPGYALESSPNGQVAHVLVRDTGGDVVARGSVVVVDGHALHDRIRTDPAHQRRGLARAVMARLGQVATMQGAQHGLLIATPEGRALYTALGWETLSPYSTAQIPPPFA